MHTASTPYPTIFHYIVYSCFFYHIFFSYSPLVVKKECGQDANKKTDPRRSFFQSTPKGLGPHSRSQTGQPEEKLHCLHRYWGWVCIIFCTTSENLPSSSRPSSA